MNTTRRTSRCASRHKVVGHAVRAMYLYSGMADIATEYNDDSLTAALETLWDDLTTKQMYVTGGIGPAASNEGFTDYYDLPNESAYAETCASVGLVFWANRMLGRGPNRRYADIMEQALYNGAMSGLSLDGKTFFYENPLESAGKHHRWIWHHCPCCPPNIARLLASIGSYMYAVADDEIAVHLYGESTARFEHRRRQGRAGPEDPLSLGRRHPFRRDARTGRRASRSRCASRNGPMVRRSAVNGEAVDLAAGRRSTAMPASSASGQSGDHVDLDIPLAPRALFANPLVRQDAGRAALMRGPLVYCVEATDNGAGLNGIRLDRRSRPAQDRGNRRAARRRRARSAGHARRGRLGQRRSTEPRRRRAEQTTARFVPYHLWDNREPGEMLVWIRAGELHTVNKMADTGVVLTDIRKSFGSLEVIHGIDLTIAEGAFVVFVGPSGCGKSTLLRMIAGLEEVTDGEIEIKGRNVTDLDPSDRGIAMVFQSYALYPHMSVRENLAFGLKMAHTDAAEIEARVKAASAILKIDHLLDRRPGQLSGGQRQRVAIGRAIVRKPDVFLFDEPLSNLDAELRVSMRIEIARLHRELGNTMIYVTHDQTEAMTLADKIVVLRDGRIEQAGTPREVYENPANIFVAGFIGSPRMNLLNAEWVGAGTIGISGHSKRTPVSGKEFAPGGSDARSSPGASESRVRCSGSLTRQGRFFGVSRGNAISLLPACRRPVAHRRTSLPRPYRDRRRNHPRGGSV